MNPSRNQKHFIDVLFTLGLLCVFAASALAVVLIGAHVYKTTAADMDANYTTRTSLSYIAKEIPGGIHTGSNGFYYPGGIQGPFSVHGSRQAETFPVPADPCTK